MTMDTNPIIEKIAKFKETDIGPTEENLKTRIVIPLLKQLGYNEEDLETEYRTKRGGRIDIFIKNVPRDCKIIIDTKNYNENLNEYVEQIKEYTFDEAALIAILANGTEIRIYSPLRGVAFERSLLYLIKREELIKEDVWNTLSNILRKDNISSKKSLRKIEEREKEIKETMANEEHLKEEYDSKIEDIENDIETKEEEISQLNLGKEKLATEMNLKLSEIWKKIGLPKELLKDFHSQSIRYPSSAYSSIEGNRTLAVKVRLQELVDNGLLKDGQILFFFNTHIFKEEQAQVVAQSNKLRYKSDGKFYSSSILAKTLLVKHGYANHPWGVQGPKYWKTGDGKLLHDLNEQIRTKRGD